MNGKAVGMSTAVYATFKIIDGLESIWSQSAPSVIAQFCIYRNYTMSGRGLTFAHDGAYPWRASAVDGGLPPSSTLRTDGNRIGPRCDRLTYSPRTLGHQYE